MVLFGYLLLLIFFVTRGIIKKTPNALTFFYSILLGTFGITYDILIGLTILNPPEIAHLTGLIFIFIQGHIVASNFGKDFQKVEQLSFELEKVNSNLEDLIHEAKEDLRNSLNESRGMLTSINKAIFCVDQKGKIFQPISKYSKEIFGKDILGLNSFNLLFFNFKDEEKKSFLASWKILFGCTESEFLFNSQELLPQKVLHPDLRKKKEGH